MRRVFTSKEIGLEVNVEKTKYMVVSRVQNAGQDHNMKIGNKFFERGGKVYISWNNPKQSKFQS
jgi:hypothetical protein